VKIFVTGGTGFIGGHFLKAAIAAGHDVLALRRAGSKTRIPLPKEPTWLEGNLDGDWSRELSQCAALVHLAAAGVSPQKASREELFDVNARQSAQLWRRALKAGRNELANRHLHRAVVISSAALSPFSVATACFAIPNSDSTSQQIENRNARRYRAGHAA
jgi:nucleoside-diphosphate-sugar epimerase